MNVRHYVKHITLSHLNSHHSPMRYLLFIPILQIRQLRHQQTMYFAKVLW